MNNSKPARVTWHKSSYSSSNGDCVEVGRRGGEALVRDTKDRTGGTLSVSARQWHALLAIRR